MKATDTIGVIIPAVIDSREADLLHEIQRQANELGYDVIAFTNASNSLDSFEQNDYVRGEEAIYELIGKVRLDGILFAAGRFFSERVIKNIAEMIAETNIPCVVLEKNLPGFTSVFTQQHGDMYAMTEHLITVHNYQKIFCLTGPQGVYEAEERLAGFRDAMTHYGLRNDWFSYGDFWVRTAGKIADDIAAGRMEMPEAVVCANDSMAIALCEALKSHNISVPIQIAVTGYDGRLEAMSYHPVITTVINKEKELAFAAVERLNTLIRHSESGRQFVRQYNISFGESCGCLPRIKHQKSNELYHLVIENRSREELYLNSNLMVRMSQGENTREFALSVHELTHLLPAYKQVDICLNENRLELINRKEAQEETKHYTQNMMMLLSKKMYVNQPDHYIFDIRHILPTLAAEHEPQFIILLPIHYAAWNLGYMALTYENGGDYLLDTFLQYWRDALANGLYTLSSKMYIEQMNRQIDEYSVRDQITGMLNKKGFLKASGGYFSGADTQCLLLVLSWTRAASSPQQKHTAEDIAIANALSLLCSEDKLCGRIGSRTYTVLMRCWKTDKRSEQVNRFLVSLEQMMQRLQGQPVLPEIPDLNCDFSVISSPEQITAVLESVKNGLADSTIKSAVTDYTSQLKRIRREIYLSPQNDWNSDMIAERFGISSGYFRKIYKDQFNVSFKEDHIAARIEKAKALLTDTGLTILEIAGQCGFRNASHFMRTFKMREGKTAVQYRGEQ